MKNVFSVLFPKLTPKPVQLASTNQNKEIKCISQLFNFHYMRKKSLLSAMQTLGNILLPNPKLKVCNSLCSLTHVGQVCPPPAMVQVQSINSLESTSINS